MHPFNQNPHAPASRHHSMTPHCLLAPIRTNIFPHVPFRNHILDLPENAAAFPWCKFLQVFAYTHRMQTNQSVFLILPVVYEHASLGRGSSRSIALHRGHRGPSRFRHVQLINWDTTRHHQRKPNRRFYLLLLVGCDHCALAMLHWIEIRVS